MYKRLELHNHTSESDGQLTTKELLDFMLEDKVDAFALTDHNTISGHAQMEALLSNNSSIECIYGMEYTTYYGHILCFNLKTYVPWENINRHQPELLFRAIQSEGALAGVAHPYSDSYPLGTCGFDMKFTDYNCIDFIEIFNNPEPLHQVNEHGLLWWEELILQGHKIATTSGMDLHNRNSMHNQFATFIKGTPDGCVPTELETAIKTQQTWVSKGPLIETALTASTLTLTLIPTYKAGFIDYGEGYTLSLRTKKGILSFSLNDKTPLIIDLDLLETHSPIILKLYQGHTLDIESLVCVAPVLYL